ncbi:hypothetical protein ACH4MY_34385 [Streptomyces sp. NPDC017246]|uniref:hypothetical protein n=1 Tax=Streptomyces sp. NPDC017246 TaxID=3364985 RepID=UPI0037901976
MPPPKHSRRLAQDASSGETESFRETFQELPSGGAGLRFGHLPEHVDQLLPLIARQQAEHMGDVLQHLHRVVRIHPLVLAALDERLAGSAAGDRPRVGRQCAGAPNSACLDACS